MGTSLGAVGRISKPINCYQHFFATRESSGHRLSNTIEFWDQIPKYCYSRRRQSQERAEFGRLSPKTREFKVKETACAVTTIPCQVEENGEVTDYLPACAEELVEEVLRYFSAQPEYGRFDGTNLWVSFSLGQIRRELKKRGHTMSFQQLVRSLTILQRSRLMPTFLSGDRQGCVEMSIISESRHVSSKSLPANRHERWQIAFSPLVSQAIVALTYRQIDYVTLLSHKFQLTRWLHRRLVAHWVQASMLHTYSIKLSSIERDSGLLELPRRTIE